MSENLPAEPFLQKDFNMMGGDAVGLRTPIRPLAISLFVYTNSPRKQCSNLPVNYCQDPCWADGELKSELETGSSPPLSVDSKLSTNR